MRSLQQIAEEIYTHPQDSPSCSHFEQPLQSVNSTSKTQETARNCEAGGFMNSAANSGGFKGGAQIVSISCSFRENFAKSYVGAPPPPGVGAPWGNPGSAAG